MNQTLINSVAQNSLQSRPSVRVGQTVIVHQKIKEGEKERVQRFEGLVIQVKGDKGVNQTFTVRAIVSGVGVEKIFPLYSPMIDKLEIVKRAKVRRAKLYYIREKVAREIKRQMRRMSLVSMSTESGAEAAAREAEEAKAREAEEKRRLKKEKEAQQEENKINQDLDWLVE